MEMFQWQFELVIFWVVLTICLSLIDEVIVGIIMEMCKWCFGRFLWMHIIATTTLKNGF